MFAPDLADGLATCSLCPRLCRPVCPVATGTAREAAVPAVIAGALREWRAGRMPARVAAEAATLCTDCGACHEHCHLGRPLPALLREARAALADELGTLDPLPIGVVEGEGEWVAIEVDDRPLARVLADRLGVPVARLRTEDRLGAACFADSGVHPRKEAHHARLRAALGARRPVIVDGGVAEVLRDAGVSFSWIYEVIPGIRRGEGSCRAEGSRPLACCGAAGPLARHHPEEAERVAKAWLARSEQWEVVDARCRAHLRAAGGTEVVDLLDLLLAGGV